MGWAVRWADSEPPRRCRTAKSAGLEVINQSRPGVRAYRGSSAGGILCRRAAADSVVKFFVDVTTAKLSTCFQRLRPIYSRISSYHGKSCRF